MVRPTHHFVASNYLAACATALVVPYLPLRHLVHITFIVVLANQAVAHEIILND